MSDEPHREVGVSHVFSVNLPLTPLQSLATHARIRGLWCCPTRSPESLLISLNRHKAIYFTRLHRELLDILGSKSPQCDKYYRIIEYM
jgi:hypothetical protein